MDNTNSTAITRQDGCYLLILVMAFLSHLTTRKLDLWRGVDAAAVAVGVAAAVAVAEAEVELPTLLLRPIMAAPEGKSVASVTLTGVLKNLPSFCCLPMGKTPSSVTSMLSAHIIPDEPCLLYDIPFVRVAIASRTGKLG